MSQVTSPIVLDSTGQDIASKLNTMNSKLEAIKNAVQPSNIYLDLELSIPTTAWSSSSPYTYTWSSVYITPECDIEVEFGDGAENVEMTYLEFEKVSGGVKFTVPSKPLAAVPVVIRVINADAEYIASVSATMVSTNAISGQSNVEQALSNVDSRITTLNSKLARTSDNCTAATGITLNNVVVERSGNVCVLHGSASIPSSLAGNNTEVLEIPAGFRPVNSVYLKLYSKYNSNLGLFTFYINAGGKLCTNTGSSTFTGDILFEITYIC